MKVQDIMSKHMLTVKPTMPVRELWKLIFVKKINAVPVVDNKNTLLGMLSKEDLLQLLYPDYEEYVTDLTDASDFDEMEKKIKNIGQLKAGDVMCKRVIYTREHTPVMRALSRMIVRHVDQLPVLSDTDTVVGILTKGDVFYALFKKRLSRTFKK